MSVEEFAKGEINLWKTELGFYCSWKNGVLDVEPEVDEDDFGDAYFWHDAKWHCCCADKNAIEEGYFENKMEIIHLLIKRYPGVNFTLRDDTVKKEDKK